MFQKIKVLLAIGVTALILSGCAAELNYNQAMPNANKFHPKVSLVLPVKMPEGFELEQEQVGNVLTNALTASGLYGQVIDPATARNQLAAAENRGLSDAVTGYLSKLMITGVSDAELTRTIGKKYHCDTIVVAEMSRYGFTQVSGNKFGEVSFSIKVIDTETGAVYWKAGHTAQEAYSFIKPDLAKMAGNLMKYVLTFTPK